MNRQPLYLMLLLALFAIALPGCLGPSEQEQRQARIDELMRRANDYRDQGLEGSAFAMFGKALLENPRIAEAHMGIGDIYKERGDYGKASVRFELAAALEPANYFAHYNLGVCKQVLGDLSYAIKSYKRALELNPDAPEANRDLASAYLQDNKAGLALAFAERAVELDDESFEAWANLGFIYLRAKRFTQAVESFRTASELVGDEDNVEPVLLGLADAHIRLGNYTRAMNTLNTVIANTPSSTAYERMGVALFKLKKYEESLDSFKKAVQLDPNDTAALNGMGVSYMTLYLEGGRSNIFQRDQALDAWTKSLEINPKQQSIINLMTRFRNT